MNREIKAKGKAIKDKLMLLNQNYLNFEPKIGPINVAKIMDKLRSKRDLNAIDNSGRTLK